jgi:hypothetical protein
MNMKMPPIQSASIETPIQMKSRKVIDNLKNTPNKEFQQLVEERLIEVMMMKMQMIQFVSIETRIQMKPMKVSNNWKNIQNKEFQHCAE